MGTLKSIRQTEQVAIRQWQLFDFLSVIFVIMQTTYFNASNSA